ncbi:hypothetical protein ACROYT_G026657 [Oculina patagonica]
MPYHGGHDLLVKLSTLLQLHGDPILRQESQLCLTATSLVFLNQCFQDITSGQQGTSGRDTDRRKAISYRDTAAITFLLDFLRRTPSLRLVPGTCSHFDGLVNISCFRALQVLEIKKVPVGFIKGFQSLRPQLKTLICTRSLISLNEVLVHCGGDLLNAPSCAWPHLKNVDFSYNGIGQVDDSVKLLPAVKVLNLSHNYIHIAEGDESLSNWRYLSDVRHLNLGYNQLECIPVPPAQDGAITFQNMTTLILKNNNLQNLKGIQAFSKLRFLDVSFNCIASLSELTPLAFLHDLISLSLQGNPVVFCPYYRRATVACLYPIPRVEPIQIDGKPLDAEEQILLGRNVYPVSMLSYIPESPLPHPRVRAVKKVADDLPESSESQEESDPAPKHRKPKRKGKKGRRVVAREIDFNDDNEVTSPSEDLLTSTSYTTPAEQILEHADDVEQLKKLRQLGGEGWLPAIDHVVHVQEEEQVINVPEPEESLLDQVPRIIRTESIQSFSEDRMEINSRTSSISVISDEDISEAHHFVVTLISNPDDDGSAEPLFVTVKDDFITEKNFTGKVISQLETSCLKDVYQDWTADNHPVTHLRFDYISRERQSRDYVMEDHEAAVQLVESLKPFVTENEQTKLKRAVIERLQCLMCSAEFTNPVNSDELLCPDCGSPMTVLVSSPDKPDKPVFTLDPADHFLGKHDGAAKLNTSSIKTLNGDMSITALVNLSTSSSSSSYLEAVDHTQESGKTDNVNLSNKNVLPAKDKENIKNGSETEKNPDVIPTETSDPPEKVPDLCSNTSGNVLIENGKDSSPETENVPKKFEVKDTGKYKVNSDSEKFIIRNRTSSQVRTSALSHSLKESAKLCPPLQTPYSSSTPSEKRGEETMYPNSTGMSLSPNRSKPIQDVIDGVQSTLPDRKLHESDQDAELLSKSLPALTLNATSKDSPKASAKKHLEQNTSGTSSMQRKISQNTKPGKGTPKSSENSSQVKLSSSLPRSPTPKMIFTNLINRLSGRVSGNSPSSSPDSPSSSSASSRASTPSIMEQNVALSFRLSADEFSSCDHKLKLYFEVSLFRQGNSEKFHCMLKAPVVVYGSTEETPCLMIVSNVMLYLCRFSVRGSGTPDECLTPLVSHPLDDLQFIDSGLGSQSFRLEFSTPGGCYDFHVREKDRCEKFLFLFTDVVQQARIKADCRAVVINPPHPQTLEHVRSQVFGMKVEDPIAMGERLHQQAVYFTDPPLIKDRKSLLRSYSNCFVGREFVDWLLQVKEAENRDEAVVIGQRLLDVGALEHVSKEQLFEDKDQYYRFNTERSELGDDSFSGDSLPDLDASIVLFIMAYRCSNTEKPHSSLNAVSVIVSRSHIALVKQNPQWPVPRYTALPQHPKGPAFVCLARHKITDVTSLDFYEDNPCFMAISITDEDAPVESAESQWILKTETVTTLSSLVKVIKEPWEAQFGVELQKNLYPSITDHKM